MYPVCSNAAQGVDEKQHHAPQDGAGGEGLRASLGSWRVEDQGRRVDLVRGQDMINKHVKAPAIYKVSISAGEQVKPEDGQGLAD